MLNQITDLIRQHAGDAVVNNPQIPNEKNEEVIEATGTGLVQAMQSQAAQGSGGLQSMLGMLGGGGGASSGIIDQVANTVASKVGISPDIARTAVAAIVPMVMSKIGQKANDPNDSSFSLEGLMSGLSGSGNPAGLGQAMSKIGGMFGK